MAGQAGRFALRLPIPAVTPANVSVQAQSSFQAYARGAKPIACDGRRGCH
jgi:hypothetical protein